MALGIVHLSILNSSVIITSQLFYSYLPVIKLSQQSVNIVIYCSNLIFRSCPILNFFHLLNYLAGDLLPPFFTFIQIINFPNVSKTFRSFIILLINQASLHHPPTIEHTLCFFAISGHCKKVQLNYYKRDTSQEYLNGFQQQYHSNLTTQSLTILVKSNLQFDKLFFILIIWRVRRSDWHWKYRFIQQKDRNNQTDLQNLIMHNLEIKKTEQQQLQQILNETFLNSAYCDDDITQFIHDPSGNYENMFNTHNSQNNNHIQSSSNLESSNEADHSIRWRKNSSLSSRKMSEEGSEIGTSSQCRIDGRSMGDIDSNQEEERSCSDINQDDYANQRPGDGRKQKLAKCIQKLNKYYQQHRQMRTIGQLKQQYPSFIISQPTYSLPKTYIENIFQYNSNTINNINITCLHIGYCTILDTYRIAIGTEDGKLLIFQRTYHKPVQVYELFTIKKKSKGEDNETNKVSVKAVRWSQNLQYLAASSSNKELKIYQFKQQIKIQNKSILRNQKQPLQLISMQKQLKQSITQIKFISQSPLSLLLNDETDQTYILDYKLHFINFKPYLNKLPLKFYDVFAVEVIEVEVGDGRRRNGKGRDLEYGEEGYQYQESRGKGEGGESAVIVAFGSELYVTIALLRPHFQIIMVYDKQKHGKNIKKQGYAHIAFRKQPLGLLIVWDKFAQMLDIEIKSLRPLQTKISNAGSQLMPETTLLAGLVTDTLVYQLSESGIKIYAVSNFSSEEKQCLHFTSSIYEHSLSFLTLPRNSLILEYLAQPFPPLACLQLLKSIACCCHGQFFLTSNTSLLGVKIQNFEQFIRNTIQNINNWKIGLQLLHDAYKGLYKNYDNMTNHVIIKLLHQYSVKYINFLMMVIGGTGAENPNEQLLWAQQTTFLFNILLETNQYQHLFNKILPKLSTNSLGRYLQSLQPYVMLHRIPQITPTGLELLFEHLLNKDIISTLLIANLKPDQNEIDLPHQINGLLLENSMYEEMVEVNIVFGDCFTPFVVLVSRYERIELSNSVVVQKNDMQVLLQLKMKNSRSESEKSEEQQNLMKKQEACHRQKQKQHLRQMIVYLTYRLLHKINKGQDLQSTLTSAEHKQILAKYRQFLQIFLPLFQTSIIHILLDSVDHQLSLFQCILPELFKNRCLQLINDISNKKFNTDLMTDLVQGIPVGRVRDLRAYWVCFISLYNLSVIKIDVFMGLRYLISYQEQLLNAKIEKLQNSKAYLYETQQFLCQTLQQSSQKISIQFSQLSQKLLEQFYNQLLLSQYCSSESHIGLLVLLARILGSGYYIRVIMAIMAQRNQDRKTMIKHRKKNPQGNKAQIKQSKEYSVYEFIEEQKTKLTVNEKQELKNIMYENIEYFIELDCQQLCDIIIQFYLHSIDKFVGYNMNSCVANRVNRGNYNGIIIGQTATNTNSNSNLTVNDYLLIQLIQGLLNRLQSVEIQSMKIDKFQPHSDWMLELKLKFLKLLALTGRQKQILTELKKQSYPLDSSLEICRKYGVIDAEAYLLVKSGGHGEIASAIRLYFNLIMDKIKPLTPENIQSFKDYLISIVKECVRVCEGLHTAPDHFNQQWFLIGQELYDMKTSIYRVLAAYTGDLLVDLIDKQIYPILAQKIIRRQNSQGIIGYLKQNMQRLDLVFIRALLHEVLKNYAYQKSIFLLAQESFIDSEIVERKKIVKQACKGVLTDGVCYMCREEEGIVIHYNNCGHQIHPSCSQDMKVCFICAFRLEKMIEKQFDLIRKIKPELYSSECELKMEDQNSKQKIRKQTAMQRLRRYEDHEVNINYW